tara:strand:+ start:11580 stop:12104 length:525 start_codon:yes stop_codon:yes gene_type:complete
MTSQEYINKITLEYLGGTIQQDSEKALIQIDTAQINFYKKRLYAAIKQHINALIKSHNDGPVQYSSSDCILTEYIDKKIKEFRIDDFADLQIDDLRINDISNSNVIESGLESIADDNILDPNRLLYNNPEQNNSTLDDFVIKKTIITAVAPKYPQEKDIMSKKFRYKGVKKREK